MQTSKLLGPYAGPFFLSNSAALGLMNASQAKFYGYIGIVPDIFLAAIVALCEYPVP